jgi:hypothetical protein
MTGHAFRETAQQHEELTGEQPWLVSPRPAGSMHARWSCGTVRPDRMRPDRQAPKKFLAGFEYHGPAGETVPLALDEVIFGCMRPNPLDPYRGLGPVQTVMVDLDSSRYSREWNRQFFLNDASTLAGSSRSTSACPTPSSTSTAKGGRNSTAGVSAAHRVALLENGIHLDRPQVHQPRHAVRRTGPGQPRDDP